jgi:hypothetical protein
LYSLARTGDNSGEHIFRTIDGIQSGPLALVESSSHIAFDTILTVILIEMISCSVRDGKSGRIYNKSSSVEFAENFRAKRLALSFEDVKTSGPLKRGGIEDLPLLRILLDILQKSRDPIR